MRAIFLIAISISVALACEAKSPTDSTQSKKDQNPRWYNPHFIPVQYAGNIGFLSAGVGYEARKKNYQLALVYGYVPKAFGGVVVHSFTAKNTFPMYRFFLDKNRMIIPYGAIGLNIEIGGRSFLTLPDNMPAGYYDFPKSTHLIASAGLKYKHMMTTKGLRSVEFFAEITTVDAYVWYKVRSDDVKMHQILSAAIGVNFMRR
jgi:hypothetical protein